MTSRCISSCTFKLHMPQALRSPAEQHFLNELPNANCFHNSKRQEQRFKEFPNLPSSTRRKSLVQGNISFSYTQHTGISENPKTIKKLQKFAKWTLETTLPFLLLDLDWNASTQNSTLAMTIIKMLHKIEIASLDLVILFSSHLHKL